MITGDLFLKVVNSEKGALRFEAHPNKELWHNASEDVMAHFSGKMPKAISLQFPREPKHSLDYRKKSYQPITKDILQNALKDITRVTDGSNYAISITNRVFEDIYKNTKFKGVLFDKWLLTEGYKYRVLDPNGLLFFKATYDYNANKFTGIDIKYIPSIWLLSFAGLDGDSLVAYKDPAKNGAISIITDTFYADIYTPKDKWEFVPNSFVVFADGTRAKDTEQSMLPVLFLGGNKESILDEETYELKEFFSSDFGHATAHLNDAASYYSQSKIVDWKFSFPLRFIYGTACKTCNGYKKIEDPNDITKTTKCDSCNGTGHEATSLSATEEIQILPTPDVMNEDIRIRAMADLPIKTEYPDVTSAQHLRAVMNECLDNARQALNVQKAVSFAQSAIAKEFDKQDQVIQILSITGDLFDRLILNGIKIMQWLSFQKGDITIEKPSSFGILSDSEMSNLYVKILELPDFQRAYDAINLTKRKYIGDELMVKATELTILYAPLTMYSDVQKTAKLSTGVPIIESIKAYYATKIIPELLNSGKLANMSDEAIFALIDKAVAGAATNEIDFANAPNLTDDDGGLE